MYLRTYPSQTSNSDVSVFNGGFRLSDDFIKQERLENHKSVWIFVDENKNKVGLDFHLEIAPQSITLTSSSKVTAGKTVWCAYLKKFDFIKSVMEDKNIKNRRFMLQRVNETSDKKELIQYEMKLPEYIPF